MYPDCHTYDKFGKRQMRTERIKQFSHATKLVTNGGFQQYLGSPKAPLICVRGNHDYADLAPMFEGCNFAHEFYLNEVIDVAGLRITGHRGIPFIYGGFSDEVLRADLLKRVHAMDPTCDVFVTHYAPENILDEGRYGLGGMGKWFARCKGLNLFGHLHLDGGKTMRVGDVLFSNAATTYNVLEGSPATGWTDVSPP